MIKVTDEFKRLSKSIKIQDLKLTINDGELTVKEVHFMPVNIFNKMSLSRLKKRKEIIAKEIDYSFEGELFKTIMKQIDLTVKNASEIKDKIVNFKYGLSKSNEFEYIDLGDFYIKDVEDDKNAEELVVTGYDKMLNFMQPFKISELELDFPCKMIDLVKAINKRCGVELYSEDFYNSHLDIGTDFFTIQQITYRDVLEKVAQATLTTIFIKENKLYLCEVKETVETLDKSSLSNLVIKEKLGPVNALVLGRGDVEDNIEAVDLISINSNGRHELRFDENEFLDSVREKVINDMLKQIDGLEYYAFEGSNIGIMWLEPADCIILKDREDTPYKCVLLNMHVKINAGITENFGAEIPEISTTQYKVTSNEEKKILKVERIAKKNEGLIEDVIEEQTDISNKLSSVVQNIDSINQTVKETLDFTVETSGKNELALIDCVDYNILKFEADAKNVEGSINFSENLKFNNNLVSKFAGQTITFCIDTQTRINPTGNLQMYSYEIRPMVHYNDKSDKFTININEDTQKCTVKILRYIKLVNGQYVTLTVPEEEILDNEIDIKLFKNTTYLYLKEYTNWNMKATYMSNPNINEYYATKVELSSEINQSADKIELEVKKKIDKTELGTYITQNAEVIQIAWNQISQYLKMEGIEGKATFNIYDKNNKMLMSLSQDGNTFYDNSGNSIGTIGRITNDSKDMLAFILDADWDASSQNSMGWGIRTKDEQFFPIFYMEGYYGQEGGEFGGYLSLIGDLSLDGINNGIICSNIKMLGDVVSDSLCFIDRENGNNFMTISKNFEFQGYSGISFLDKISFFKNQGGTNTLRVGYANQRVFIN